MGYYRIILVLFLAIFLSNPPFLDASTAIVLTKGEEKLVQQGDLIVREISTNNKSGRTFEAIGLINAPRNSIIQVLTEYEKYPEFMPNVSRIDIVEQKDEVAVLNYTLSLPLGKTKKYRLRITMAEHDNRATIIEWKMLKWPGLKTDETIKNTTGYWRIEETSANSALVLYHVYTDPGPIPLGLGWIVDVLSKNSVPETLLQTKAKAETIALETIQTTY